MKKLLKSLILFIFITFSITLSSTLSIFHHENISTVEAATKKTFTTFTVNSVYNSSTKITGKGTKGATVKAYVNGKEIGKSTVASSGTYSIKIAKKNKNTKITVKISKSGYTTKSKTITVKSKQITGRAYPSTSGALSVKGTQLVNSKGEAVQLKGISTHGLAWFPQYVNEASFRQLRQEWNINVIRLAMYTAEYGGYCTGGNKEALKALVRKGVKYATNQDMYAIIDWHILSDGNPNTYKKEAKKFFAEMSKEFANHNNVIYEICNEPNGGTSWSSIKSYAEEIIRVIRANDSDAVIIVGTPNWSQYVDQVVKNPIKTSKNIMYALHFYAATHNDSLRNTMVSSIKAGLPIFVSEYGICDASGNGAIDKNQANKWVETMNQYGVSYVAWNLSNKGETSAIIKSSSKKTSGFTSSDLTESGKWLYSMLTGNSSFQSSNTQSKVEETTKPSNGGQNTTTNSGSVVSLTNNQVKYTVELINSWESGEKKFYHYNLTLKNSSSKNGKSWSITIPFNGNFNLVDSWNGVYKTQNKSLSISSKDYNGAIASGGTIGNVGFIVSGSNSLKIIK